MSGRLWALVALQAAVAVAWKVYAYFQPRLLAHFGFDALAGLLGWYLALAGSTLAPLAGDASDRLVRSGGDRFPVVRAGVALAAASFVAVALTAMAEAGSPVRFVLPLFVAIWIAGMTVFQAPALAILRDLVRRDEAVGAMAPLVVASLLPTVLWPWVEPVLATLGGSITFLVGGVAVTITALALGRTVPMPATASTPDHAETSPLVAFACGIVSAVVAVLAAELVPTMLARTAAVGVEGLAAVAAVAASSVAFMGRRVQGLAGERSALLAGAALAVVGRAIAPSCTGSAAAFSVATITGVGLGLHLTTALPYLLGGGSRGRAGLVTGLYLGGAMLGSRLVWVIAASLL